MIWTGVVPGVLAPGLLAGVTGSSTADATAAQWLFGIALSVVVIGEVLLLIAMYTARTFRPGAVAAWSGLLLGAAVGVAYPEFLFRHWGWLGYCACLPVALAPFFLAVLADDARTPGKAVAGLSRPSPD